jgi:tetratricopeptide (TPR) repeat protein
LCPIFVLLAALCAPADVIHLKNGRTIWADHVHQDTNNGTNKNDRVEYDVGEDTYAIPKSAVERIDSGGTAPARRGSEIAVPDLALAAPSFAAPSFAGHADLAEKVIRDGKVDKDALAALAQAGDSELVGTAYFLAAKHESDGGNFPAAKAYYESALRFQPENSTLLVYYSACLMRLGQASQALPYAQRAVRAAPESPDALAMLGFVEFASDHSEEAIRWWKKSLAIRPDANVHQYIEKAERELKAEAGFSQRESSHFNLHFEGKETPENFRRGVLATLDSDFDDLVRDLGYSPRENIAVTLYTQQAFFDVTRAPSWTGAINDGKLRIPVSGVTSVTPELARVLKHELTHSFVAQITGNRCPTWLNEGVAQMEAQMEEGSSTAGNGHILAQMFAASAEIPFNMLEGSFLNFNEAESRAAYAESLAAAEYLRDTYGMAEIQQILERLGQGSSTEAALRGTIHSDYRQLRDEMTRWLVAKYGK